MSLRANHIAEDGSLDAANRFRELIDRTLNDANNNAGAPLDPARRDIANADLFVRTYQDELRYIHSEKYWLLWNGQYWERCQCGEDVEKAKNLIEDLFSAYAELVRLVGIDAAKPFLAHCKYSATKKGIDNLLAIARSDPKVALQSPAVLDSNPWLFQVRNGVVDLKTGELVPPLQEMLITRVSPLVFDPAAHCPQWMNFLDQVFMGDHQTIESLQQLAGYSLTGDVREEIMVVLLGVGANGKSVFNNVMRHIWGGYGKAGMATIVTASGDETMGSASPELASLCGTRLVSINETREGDKLNEQAVKRAAGTEAITARNLYAAPFEFDPSAKVWLRTNHRPIVRGTDDGIWRRLVLVRFPRCFSAQEQDKALFERLIAEASGIFNWIITGCLSWQEYGLGLSPTIRKEMQCYREESDLLGDFLSHFELDPKEHAADRKFYQKYRGWCFESGHRPLTKNSFTRSLAERGISHGKVGGVRSYLGVKDNPKVTFSCY